MKKRIFYVIGSLAAIWLIGLVISLMTGAVTIKFNEGGDSKDFSKKTDDGPYLTFKDNYGLIGYLEKGKYTFERKPLSEFRNKSFKVITDQVQDSFNFVVKNKILIPPFVYQSAPKILAVSDIEGNFFALKNILKGNGLIDKSFKWTYGKNHLVIIGDLVDRGLNVTQCLWLIYKLEDEADKAGGKVHYILGNHEIMVMSGDVRYSRNKYMEISREMGLDYSTDVFGKASELGHWMRSKNIVEKIGNTLFVHAGISADINEQRLTLKKMNEVARKYYGASKTTIGESEIAKEIYGKNGPLWYRGITKKKLSQDEVNSILHFYGAEKMVVGHSIVENILGLYDKKIIAIDLVQPEQNFKSAAKALLIENRNCYEVAEKGKKRMVNGE